MIYNDNAFTIQLRNRNYTSNGKTYFTSRAATNGGKPELEDFRSGENVMLFLTTIFNKDETWFDYYYLINLPALRLTKIWKKQQYNIIYNPDGTGYIRIKWRNIPSTCIIWSHNKRIPSYLSYSE